MNTADQTKGKFRLQISSYRQGYGHCNRNGCRTAEEEGRASIPPSSHSLIWNNAGNVTAFESSYYRFRDISFGSEGLFFKPTCVKEIQWVFIDGR
ncbi:hypothetical protein V2J09_001654 [Rumex salicifolius]